MCMACAGDALRVLQRSPPLAPPDRWRCAILVAAPGVTDAAARRNSTCVTRRKPSAQRWRADDEGQMQRVGLNLEAGRRCATSPTLGKYPGQNHPS